jgi:hypothetical protein
MGWHARRATLDKKVYDKTAGTVGSVVELIIYPDKTVAYPIIGVDVLSGMGRHEGVVPGVPAKRRGLRAASW